MLEGPVLVDIKIVRDRDEQMDVADQAQVLKDYATENLIGYENIGVDAVGIGVGVVDHAKKLETCVHEFMSGAASTETMWVKNKDGERVEVATYANLRSQLAHQLARAIENGQFFFYSGCPFLSEFKKEATMHNYEIRDKVLWLEPKEKVKERLGQRGTMLNVIGRAPE